MSEPKIARRRLGPDPRTPTPFTLDDLTVTWEEGGERRTVSGRDLARVLTLAARTSPALFFRLEPGFVAYRLKGLAGLLNREEAEGQGETYDPDARAFLDHALRQCAAELEAAAMDDDRLPARFTLEVARGASADFEARAAQERERVFAPLIRRPAPRRPR